MVRTNYKRKGNAVICFVLALFILASLCSAMDNSKATVKAIKPAVVNAKTETWYNQNFWDVFWGTGIWKTRTKYTINPNKLKTMEVILNKRYSNTVENKTNTSQSVTYTETETNGYTYNSDVSGQIGHFKAALGVSLSKAKTSSIAVTVKAPKKTTIKAYISDVKISEQTSNYKSEIQRSSLSGNWVHYDNGFSKKPVVNRYKGHKISYVTAKKWR